VGGDVVVVAPLVEAHLLADDLDHGGRTIVDVASRAQLVDGQGSVVPMRHRPDDVLWAKRGVPAEEHARERRCHRCGIDLRHIPLVELNPDVAFDPRESVFLADRHQHIIAREVLIRLAGRNEVAAPLGVVFGFYLLEKNAGEAAIFVRDLFRHEEIQNGDVLVHGVLLFPRGRFHFLEPRTNDHLDVLAVEPARAAAAVHGGVAAAEHDDAFADPVDVPERDRGEPVDADMDVRRGLFAAGDVEIATARRAAADEDRIPTLRHQRLEAVDAFAAAKFDPEIEDVVAFLVDNGFRQAEARDLRADHAARLWILIEYHAFVAERREVAGDRKRGGAAAHERDALAILDRCRLGQAGADIVLEVGGNPL